MVEDNVFLDAVARAMAHPPDTKDNSCPKCGKKLIVGDWPFCPHGKAHGGFKLKGEGWSRG